MVKQKYFALGIILSLMASAFLLHSVSASMVGTETVSANSFEAIAIEVDPGAVAWVTASSDSNYDLYLVSSSEYNNNVVEGNDFIGLDADEAAAKDKEVEWENTGSLKVTVYLLLVNRGDSSISISYRIVILKQMQIAANDFGIIQIDLNSGATIRAVFNSESIFSAVLLDSENYNLFAEAWNAQEPLDSVTRIARYTDVSDAIIEYTADDAETLYFIIVEKDLAPMTLIYGFNIQEAESFIDGYNFFILLGIASFASMLLSKKLKMK